MAGEDPATPRGHMFDLVQVSQKKRRDLHGDIPVKRAISTSSALKMVEGKEGTAGNKNQTKGLLFPAHIFEGIHPRAAGPKTEQRLRTGGLQRLSASHHPTSLLYKPVWCEAPRCRCVHRIHM